MIIFNNTGKVKKFYLSSIVIPMKQEEKNHVKVIIFRLSIFLWSSLRNKTLHNMAIFGLGTKGLGWWGKLPIFVSTFCG